MQQPPNITFIICTYNRAAYLEDTLYSIFQHDLSGLNFELLVIDNNSTDRTAEIVAKYRQKTEQTGIQVRYIKETSQGLSHARNRGIVESKGSYTVFLDDDIRATPSLIPAWLSFFAEQPDAVAAGGKIHVQFDAPRPFWMSRFLLPLLGHHDLGKSRKKYPKNKYPFGGNMGFDKSVFSEVGLFDTSLGRKGKSLNAGEEKELFKRIYTVSRDIYYLPKAFLYHRVDEGRLTVEYIKGQAYGLGASMKLRLKKAGLWGKLINWAVEFGKLTGSILLGIFYTLRLNPSKATMLLKFRWWIWKGYWEND